MIEAKQKYELEQKTKNKAKRRKDNIYVCNKCNKQYPINKENNNG